MKIAMLWTFQGACGGHLYNNYCVHLENDRKHIARMVKACESCVNVNSVTSAKKRCWNWSSNALQSSGHLCTALVVTVIKQQEKKHITQQNHKQMYLQ